MTKLILLAALFTSVFALTACGDPGYTNINNEELQNMLDNNPEYQFVDVRTSTEYYEEHAVGFTYLIDYYMLEDDYSMLDILDKDVPVVLMCRTGNRSVEAAKILVEEGFTTVYNHREGITGWNGETE